MLFICRNKNLRSSPYAITKTQDLWLREVNAKDQNLATQIDELQRFGVDKIVSEKITSVAKKEEQTGRIAPFFATF